MIKQLRMKNFRQHLDKTINFTAGVSVIRGLNEKGKTTIFEAIAYAMFGTRALRNGDVSSWGEPRDSHEVHLTLEVGGVEYAIKRNKRSAEIRYDGEFVTGQAPTSEFLAQLLGMPTGAGEKLMFASQGSMRGILLDTPVHATKMIEDLAGFTKLDEIMEHLTTNWHTGRTTVMESSVENAKHQVVGLQEQLAELQNLDVQEAQAVDTWTVKLQEATENTTATNELVKRLENTLSQVQQAETQRADINRRIDDLDKQESRLRERVESLPIEFDHESYQTLKDNISYKTKQLKDYQDFLLFSDWQPNRISGTLESLQNELNDILNRKQEVHTRQGAVHVSLSNAKKALETDESCPTCKREWGDVEERRKQKQQAEQVITQLNTEWHQLQLESDGLTKRSEEIEAATRQRFSTIPEGSQWVQATDEMYPPVYVWTGGKVDAVTPKEIADLQRLFDAKEKERELFAAAGKTREMLWSEIGAVQEARRDLNKQLQAVPVFTDSVAELADALRTQQSELVSLMAHQKFCQGELERLPNFYATKRQEKQRLGNLLERAETEVSLREAELEESKQAAALLQILRKARPVLASRVWQKLSTLMSDYFSKMRGVPAKVERTSDGFTVDGHDALSLSGSTLDILGLAIRVALTQTFVPSCHFLMLDEPFAAADDERTSQALGFLKAVGFNQVIIITHEDTTEAIADNLITL